MYVRPLQYEGSLAHGGFLLFGQVRRVWMTSAFAAAAATPVVLQSDTKTKVRLSWVRFVDWDLG